MGSRNLLPFYGFLVPGVYFPGGHCLWFANFTATPTDIGGYAQVWLIAPTGKRVLFVQPEAAGPTVCLFHDPHEAYGATMKWRWPAPRCCWRWSEPPSSCR